MRLRLLIAALAICIAPAAQAFEPRETGIVLMHGKWGRAGDQTTAPLAARLMQAGFVVVQPDMPWSGSRAYDIPLDAAMAEIDAALDQLRGRNLKHLVVAGQSQGGSAALLHATTGKRVDAYVLIAPAPRVEAPGYQKRLAADIERARELVATGQDRRQPFLDLNSDDRTRTSPILASSYLSYNAADGPGNLARNAERVGTAPILWVGGTLDVGSAPFGEFVWPRFPEATPKTRVDVIAHHMDTPAAGSQPILDWLRKQ
jgi:pimeloyl-ACP methyl ester carboxylesterase